MTSSCTPRHIVYLVTWFCIGTLISACTPTEPDTGSTAPPATVVPDHNWSATLIIAGGLAGQLIEITVDQSGKALLSDKRRNTRIEKQLTRKELERIAQAMTSLPASSKTVNRFSKCRDCYLYTLTAVDNGNPIKITADDLSLQNSDARELIQLLSTLATEMRK